MIRAKNTQEEKREMKRNLIHIHDNNINNPLHIIHFAGELPPCELRESTIPYKIPIFITAGRRTTTACRYMCII